MPETDSWSGSVPRETPRPALRREPGSDEAATELLEALEPHEEHQRAAGRRERIVVGLAAVGAVAARNGDAVGDAAVRDGDQCRGGNRRDRRDAGDDLEVDPGLGERERFFAATTEDERVAALEPDDIEAGRAVGDEQARDRVLLHAGAGDDDCVIGSLVDELLRDEHVGDEHVARAQRARDRGR